MKQRATTTVSIKGIATKSVLIAAAVLTVIGAPLSLTQQAYADRYDDQINAIQAKIDEYNAQAKQLAGKAETLEAELQRLTNEKLAIQAQIDLSQAKFDKLTADIKANEKKLADTKEALGQIIADMYVDSSISPIEMLASSKNIGEYVDKQQYRDSISDNLKTAIDDIKRIKAEMEQQKIEVERVLLDQKNARNALQIKENEQAALVEQTRNEEASFQKLSAEKRAEKLRVQQEQQAAIWAASNRYGGPLNISGGDGSMGGYPWAGGCWVDANAWSHGGSNGMGGDPLGYGCRQCVSYAAWKVYQKTGYAPRYWGNANMWPGSARGVFEVGRTPRANSLGVISAGQYGHIVYIESYNSANNTVRVSQFNYFNAGGPGWGNYSEMTLSANTYDTYIYLP